VNLAHTPFLTPILLWAPEGRISGRQPAGNPPSNQQLHQFHKVFRI
jgi:hypothetical protein